MKRIIMLTIIISLSLLLFGCNNKEKELICSADEIIVDGECSSDTSSCKISENDTVCYIIMDGECNHFYPVCPEDTHFEDYCKCVDDNFPCNDGDIPINDQCFADEMDAIYSYLEGNESTFIEQTEMFDLENSIIQRIDYHYVDGILSDYIYVVEYNEYDGELIRYLISFDNFGFMSSFFGVSKGNTDQIILHFDELETNSDLIVDELPDYEADSFNENDISARNMFDSFNEIKNYHQNIVLLSELNKDYDGYYSFYVDGEYRKYKLYIPENIEVDAPLVMALHGFTGSSDTIKYISGFNDLADEYGFAVVYPLGSNVPGFEIAHWNAGLDYSEVDDVKFLTELVTFLQSKYSLSSENTFVTGFSNGGFMSYTLACEARGTFKAYAPVSGLMSKETWDTCDMTSTPILHIHGSVDNVVPIDGSMLTEGGWGGAPELSVILNAWIEVNGNSLVEEVTINEVTSYYKYSNELNTDYIWYYEVKTYNHIWPGSIDRYVPLKTETAGFDASKIIWEFFSIQID